MVGESVDSCLRQLTQKKYRNARSHVDLIVLSLVCRALGEEGAAWKKPELTNELEKHWADSDHYQKSWRLPVYCGRRSSPCEVLEERSAGRARRGKGFDIEELCSTQG